MKHELIGGSIGTGISALGTAMQTNELLQTISLVITIIGGLITFIIMPVINWYQNVKKDGKITKEEVDEGVKIIQDGLDKLKDQDKKEK